MFIHDFSFETVRRRKSDDAEIFEMKWKFIHENKVECLGRDDVVNLNEKSFSGLH